MSDVANSISSSTSSLPYQIYCDLDGVLVNFELAFKQLSGGKDWDSSIRDLGLDKTWELVNAEGSKWWANLEWQKDGHQLWEFLKDKNPIILSAGATSVTKGLAEKGKRIWCARELGTNVEVIVADRGTDKKYWSEIGHILIDDLEENIRAWRARGGIGIHHKNAPQTILELKQYIQQISKENDLDEDWRSLAAAGLVTLGTMIEPNTAMSAIKAPIHHTVKGKQPQKKVVTMPQAQNMNIMAATLIGEAGGEGIKGMQAVANVIMNRADGDFAKTGLVCVRPYQFSMWNKKQDQIESVVAKAQQHPRWKDAMLLVQQAKDGTLQDITDGSTFYFNPKLAKPSWASDFEKTTSIGNHVFYKHGNVNVSRFY